MTAGKGYWLEIWRTIVALDRAGGVVDYVFVDPATHQAIREAYGIDGVGTTGPRGQPIDIWPDAAAALPTHHPQEALNG